MTTADGTNKRLGDIAYGNQPAGYAARPAEVVNYIENHDNQTLWDIDAWRLPPGTSSAERARVQLLAAALTAFSQGVAYFHAGVDLLRSKSLDRNSFDSGDWFNRLDFSYRDNYFGTGLPPKQDNGGDWEMMRPLLNDPALRATPQDIAFMRDGFRDLLRIRASSSLFRLRTAGEIEQR
jgi:pullulanase/glycogen debranching enzyme